MALTDLLKRIPVPICGLALGLASLDRLLVTYYGIPLSVFAFASAVILGMFTLRAVIDRGGLAEELGNPVVFGVLPTYCMALMILSTYAEQYVHNVGLVIWIISIMMFIAMIAVFIGRFVVRFDIGNVFPSWFVMFVGYVVASMTAPAFSMEPLGRALFWCGLASYAVLLPVILLRIFKRGIPRPARPNIAIFAAPMNLCIAGYFASFAFVNGLLVDIMAVVAIISYVAVLCCMPFMLRGFYPSFAAFTFPMVIASVSLHILFPHYGLDGTVFDSILIVTALFAAAVVAYVLIRYVIFIACSRDGVTTTRSRPRTP